MKEENNKLLKALYNIETVLFVLITVFAVSTIVWIFLSGPIINVSGTSMNPTYYEGDCLTGVKVSSIEEVSYNDVIVFRDPESYITLLIKRVIGLPGDTIVVTENGVYRNDELIKDDFPTSFSGNDYEYVTVGENEIYALGDNRDHSRDSRTFGCFNVFNVKYIVTGESNLAGTWIYNLVNKFTDAYAKEEY